MSSGCLGYGSTDKPLECRETRGKKDKEYVNGIEIFKGGKAPSTTIVSQI
jgi:hypothetical protein